MSISKSQYCKCLLFIFFVGLNSNLLAQKRPAIQSSRTDSLQILNLELTKLKEQDQLLRRELNAQKEQNGEQARVILQQQKQLDSLKMKLIGLSTRLEQSIQMLQGDIAVKHNKTLGEVEYVSDELSSSRWIGLGLGGLLCLLGILAYAWQRRWQSKKHQDLHQAIDQSRIELESQIVGELIKQTQLLEAQSNELKSKVQIEGANTEPDHSLALKLAGEITTIERNISLMDEGTRGLKQLKRSVSKLKDNLLSNGYEIPELLNKKHVQGMNLVVVNTHHNENMEEGQEVITKVLVPQVNYQGRMIQSAQVELTIG